MIRQIWITTRGTVGLLNSPSFSGRISPITPQGAPPKPIPPSSHRHTSANSTPSSLASIMPNPITTALTPEQSMHPRLHLDPRHFISNDYTNEANKYIAYFRMNGLIPGVHKEFDHLSIDKYLFWRARTTKSLRGILSKLKWMGMVYGFILPTQKHQQPSLLYDRIMDSLRRANKWIRSRRPVQPFQALALDNKAVCAILSYYQCYSRQHCARLPEPALTWCCHAILCHSAGMRYGHFSAQDLNRADLQRNPLADCWQLTTRFSKYDSGEPHVIRFFDAPHQACAYYHLTTPDGTPSITVTASIFASWYIAIRDARHRANGGKLFPSLSTRRTPIATAAYRRQAFTAFLRHTFTAAIPGFTHRMRIRPHGFRAGWVSDRRREGAPDEVIKREGRWSSIAAMNIYDRTCFRDICPTTAIRFCRLATRRLRR